MAAADVGKYFKGLVSVTVEASPDGPDWFVAKILRSDHATGSDTNDG